MTTLVTQDSLRELKTSETIPAPLRAYFQQRLYSRVHQLLLDLLRAEERTNDAFCKRKLSKRIEKKPEQITRWLSYPGNMTLETLSDLMLGMGCEMSVEAVALQSNREERKNNNFSVILVDFKMLATEPSDTFIDRKKVSFVSRSYNKDTFIPRQEVPCHA